MPETAKWKSEEVGRYYDDGGVAWFQAIMGSNSHVGLWHGPGDDTPLDRAAERLNDFLFAKLDVTAGERVLDLGCGAGGPGVRLARQTGADVTGVAISAEQVRIAGELAGTGGLADRVRFERADAMSLPFADASFDAVLALESIMHMPERGTVLAEVVRVLCPGGRLVLTDLYERTAVTADRQAPIAACLDAMFSTAAGPDDYPRLVRTAGLLWTELIDITEDSWSRTHEEMAGLLRRNRTQLDALGEQFVAGTDPVMSTVFDIPEIGYLVLAALKPA